MITKQFSGTGRNTTEYHLTQAGQDLLDVITSLRVWGERWAFGDPTPEELDPVLLMWWLRKRANNDRLPAERIVVQFDFRGAKKATFWLILTTNDVSICLTEPGYEINVLITADLAVFLKLWAGRISYQEALQRGLKVDDSTAFSLCMDNGMPMQVFGMEPSGNVTKAILGAELGTIVSNGVPVSTR